MHNSPSCCYNIVELISLQTNISMTFYSFPAVLLLVLQLVTLGTAEYNETDTSFGGFGIGVLSASAVGGLVTGIILGSIFTCCIIYIMCKKYGIGSGNTQISMTGQKPAGLDDGTVIDPSDDTLGRSVHFKRKENELDEYELLHPVGSIREQESFNEISVKDETIVPPPAKPAKKPIPVPPVKPSTGLPIGKGPLLPAPKPPSSSYQTPTVLYKDDEEYDIPIVKSVSNLKPKVSSSSIGTSKSMFKSLSADEMRKLQLIKENIGDPEEQYDTSIGASNEHYYTEDIVAPIVKPKRYMQVEYDTSIGASNEHYYTGDIVAPIVKPKRYMQVEYENVGNTKKK